MTKSTARIQRKVTGRIARHKNVRYHNDAYLFTDHTSAFCLTCDRPVTIQKASHGSIFCSRTCQVNV